MYYSMAHFTSVVVVYVVVSIKSRALANPCNVLCHVMWPHVCMPAQLWLGDLSISIIKRQPVTFALPLLHSELDFYGTV